MSVKRSSKWLISLVSGTQTERRCRRRRRRRRRRSWPTTSCTWSFCTNSRQRFRQSLTKWSASAFRRSVFSPRTKRSSCRIGTEVTLNLQPRSVMAPLEKSYCRKVLKVLLTFDISLPYQTEPCHFDQSYVLYALCLWQSVRTTLSHIVNV